MPETSLILPSPAQKDLTLHEERRLIAIAKAVGGERKRSRAYHRLQLHCCRIIKRLIAQYQRHYPFHDREELLSAANEGFATAVYAFDFSSSARLTSVVFIYVRNALQTLMRQEYRQRCAAIKVKYIDVGFARDPDIRDTHQIATLVQLLSHLSPGQQSVFKLRFTTRLTWDEIARVLGKSKAAVEKQYSRGLTKLRALWLRHQGGSYAAA